MQTEKWMKWAVLEGFTKICSRVFQKVVGNVSNTWGGTFLAASIVGLVQVVFAGLVMWRKKISFFNDPVGAFGSAMFGVFALISTVLGFATFLMGGDISTSTFIITLSIVPGMIIDIIFFKFKSTMREWIGMSVAIFAGYVILGLPSISSLASMPTWVWLSFAGMMSVAINQGITQGVKKVDPMFKNFWGGLMSLILSPIVLIFMGEGNKILQFSENLRLWGASVTIGFIVICMWAFNLLSYKTGASIALKKLVMNSTYLVGTLFTGYLFFNEAITANKLLSIPLFCLAFILMDKKAWEFVKQKYDTITRF
jgi:drug/metabolite transporter (DMT)-like permease